MYTYNVIKYNNACYVNKYKVFILTWRAIALLTSSILAPTPNYVHCMYTMYTIYPMYTMYTMYPIYTTPYYVHYVPYVHYVSYVPYTLLCILCTRVVKFQILSRLRSHQILKIKASKPIKIFKS